MVNKEECISCQLCADLLPQVFRMDDRGLAEVHASDAAPHETIQKVMDACPKVCIIWIEP